MPVFNTAFDQPNDAVPNRYLPRRRELPGPAGLWKVNASAFTATNGVANAASVITGSILVSATDTSAFRYLGGNPGWAGNTYPNYNYIQAGGSSGNGYTGTSLTYPSGKTSVGLLSVEFDIEALDGQFEIDVKGSGLPIRVIIDGYALAAVNPTFTTAADGNGYRHLVSGLSAGWHRVHIDNSSPFQGIRMAPTNTIVAAPAKPIRCLVQGDSFSEPTISDSSVTTSVGGDGWPQKFAWMTGWDVWSAAKGSTGYVNPGVTGNVAITDTGRITDITRNKPDVVIIAAGINDIGYAGATAASIGAAALTTLQAYRAALPNALLIVLSSFWQQDYTTFPALTVAANDAIKASAASIPGAIFLDLLRFPYPSFGQAVDTAVTAQGTLTDASGTAVNATTFTSATKYPTNTIVQVGNDSNAEIKKITNVTGTGPWTHTVSAFGRTHANGSVLIPVGPSYVTGNGKQGATSGLGNADRYRGSDGTHPTVAGHEHIARTVFELLCNSLPA